MLNLPNTIKMVITDFDGIVTDNCVYINDDFSMSRKLNFKDVMAFSILKKNGFKIGIISGEKNSSIEI
jgi:3-deoxy-D-manno-octulosonate 8-phosphate phosphatase KdsC-like HAD superfamily phosphatase